jgi:spore maturation protein SpmA
VYFSKIVFRMALNYIWIFFFLASFVLALIQTLLGNTGMFPAMFQAILDMSKTSFEIALGLTGLLTFWMGIMKVGEKAGVVAAFARMVTPFFSKLFPSIPSGHPSTGLILMNFSANMLGLDSAATGVGLKAMASLQEINPDKDRASDAQIMFLVLNASGLTIIPMTIMMYRAQQGAENPTDVFIPLLMATFASTLTGLVVTSIYQRINLLRLGLLIPLLVACTFIAGLAYLFSSLSASAMELYSELGASFIMFGIVVLFIAAGALKRLNVMDAFIEGAKEGFGVVLTLIPYMVGILVAIAVFRTSGALELILNGLKWVVFQTGMDTRWIDAMPTAIMKPLSGGGARGMMIDTMKTFGPDSFAGRLSCIFQGAADTTLYILAVYFGSVGIKNSRYAVTCGLLADLGGVIAAIWVAYLFFG